MGDYHILMQFDLAADRATVRRALATPGEIATWWSSRTGGFPPWWAGTTIRWDLADNPDAAGTRLLFSHRDYDPENPVIPTVTPAWGQIILRLKTRAETGARNPFFDF